MSPSMQSTHTAQVFGINSIDYKNYYAPKQHQNQAQSIKNDVNVIRNVILCTRDMCKNNFFLDYVRKREHLFSGATKIGVTICGY